ncbi:MAG: hypothetical protein J2P17_00165 [Mycobacterium sp.]|nr:hypothetical protein [Mycobacterium sp.]
MLTLEIKINRMFELGHSHDQPERSTNDVAEALSRRIGTRVDPQIITAARSGQSQSIDPRIAEALCDEFDIETYYLLEDESERVTHRDLLMQLWILIRDRGEVLCRESLLADVRNGHDLDSDTIRDMISTFASISGPVAPPAALAADRGRAPAARRAFIPSLFS